MNLLISLFVSEFPEGRDPDTLRRGFPERGPLLQRYFPKGDNILGHPVSVNFERLVVCRISSPSLMNNKLNDQFTTKFFFPFLKSLSSHCNI